jgi:hypothetical protein
MKPCSKKRIRSRMNLRRSDCVIKLTFHSSLILSCAWNIDWHWVWLPDMWLHAKISRNEIISRRSNNLMWCSDEGTIVWVLLLLLLLLLQLYRGSLVQLSAAVQRQLSAAVQRQLIAAACSCVEAAQCSCLQLCRGSLVQLSAAVQRKQTRYTEQHN